MPAEMRESSPPNVHCHEGQRRVWDRISPSESGRTKHLKEKLILGMVQCYYLAWFPVQLPGKGDNREPRMRKGHFPPRYENNSQYHSDRHSKNTAQKGREAARVAQLWHLKGLPKSLAITSTGNSILRSSSVHCHDSSLECVSRAERERQIKEVDITCS